MTSFIEAEVQRVLADLRTKLVQAKAPIFCALPYSRIPDRSVTRRARIGRDSVLNITVASIEPGIPLPYGADRALLGWIQTLCYHDRFVSFDTLTQFFRAFGLSDSGGSTPASGAGSSG
jgi:hypothetical protein